MVRTPSFCCQGHMFSPWGGNYDIESCTAWLKNKYHHIYKEHQRIFFITTIIMIAIIIGDYFLILKMQGLPQWLRLCLAMQGTWVQSLSGIQRAHAVGQLGPRPSPTEPAHASLCATTPEKPTCHRIRSHVLQRRPHGAKID